MYLSKLCVFFSLLYKKICVQRKEWGGQVHLTQFRGGLGGKNYYFRKDKFENFQFNHQFKGNFFVQLNQGYNHLFQISNFRD